MSNGVFRLYIHTSTLARLIWMLIYDLCSKNMPWWWLLQKTFSEVNVALLQPLCHFPCSHVFLALLWLEVSNPWWVVGCSLLSSFGSIFVWCSYWYSVISELSTTFVSDTTGVLYITPAFLVWDIYGCVFCSASYILTLLLVVVHNLIYLILTGLTESFTTYVANNMSTYYYLKICCLHCFSFSSQSS